MVTLITGASSGIGEEFSRRYAAKKHELVLVARRQDKLDALAEELRKEHGVEVTTISLDLSEPDAAQRLWNETNRRGLAVVGLTARYLPAMRKRGSGTIINISSAAAFQPMPHMAVYGATKAFVLSFTEALWRETRRDGIRVLAVCPGSTDTPFFQVADEGTVVGRLRSTRQVLDTTMRALRGSGPSVVDGLGNAVVARFLTRVLPQRALLAAVDRVFRH